MNLSRLGGLALVVAMLSSCHSDDDASGALVTTLKVGEPWADPFIAPPIWLTWFVRYTENSSAATMSSYVSTTLQTLSDTLWDVSEGQLYIRRVEVSDKALPGLKASDGLPDDATVGSDVIVYSAANWDLAPVLGYVLTLSGRGDRVIAVPDNATNETLLHEASHLAFALGWAPGPLLVDEYKDGLQDAVAAGVGGCIMEDPAAQSGGSAPYSWCSNSTHVAQTSQPHACWKQILGDYAAFSYAGTNTGMGAAPAIVQVIKDNP